MGYLVFGGCAAFVKSEFIRTFAAVCCGLCPWFAGQVRKNETKKSAAGRRLGALLFYNFVANLLQIYCQLVANLLLGRQLTFILHIL